MTFLKSDHLAPLNFIFYSLGTLFGMIDRDWVRQANNFTATEGQRERFLALEKKLG